MGETLTELRERRAADGEWTPPGYPTTIPPDPPPDDDPADAPQDARLPRRRKVDWTSEEISAGLLHAAELAHERRTTLDQRELKRLAKVDTRIPSWSVVDRRARKLDASQTADDWVKEAVRVFDRQLRA